MCCLVHLLVSSDDRPSTVSYLIKLSAVARLMRVVAIMIRCSHQAGPLLYLACGRIGIVPGRVVALGVTLTRLPPLFFSSRSYSG